MCACICGSICFIISVQTPAITKKQELSLNNSSSFKSDHHVYKYLPGSACIDFTGALSEAFSLGSIPQGLTLLTAEPAVMLMALIYTQEDIDPSDLLCLMVGVDIFYQEPNSRVSGSLPIYLSSPSLLASHSLHPSHIQSVVSQSRSAPFVLSHLNTLWLLWLQAPLFCTKQPSQTSTHA